MINDITKYVREVGHMAQSLCKIIEEAGTDQTISQGMREDLRWELARLNSSFADVLASMVRVYIRHMEDSEP